MINTLYKFNFKDNSAFIGRIVAKTECVYLVKDTEGKFYLINRLNLLEDGENLIKIE